MSYTIRPSADVEIKKAPTIALAGPTGSGKTESALRMARGYVGQSGKFVIVDTEEKRALYKKARYQPWDWLDFQPPFSPMAYRDALDAAKTYQAVILDSGSHEWSGDGGCLDMQSDALERMSKGDATRAERLTALAWRDAKLEHKRFMSQLIRYPVLLIVCLRAEPKIKFLKDAQGKTQIVDAGYQPICEKMFGYEMLIFAMMHSDNPGFPIHLKKLEADLEPVFADGKQVDEQTGRRLAQWAAGASPNSEARPMTTPATPPPAGSFPTPSAASDLINDAQESAILDQLQANGVSIKALLAKAGIAKLRDMEAARVDGAIKWIKAQRKD